MNPREQIAIALTTFALLAACSTDDTGTSSPSAADDHDGAAADGSTSEEGAPATADAAGDDQVVPSDTTTEPTPETGGADGVADGSTFENCPVQVSPTFLPHAAKSGGFSGSADAYDALYDVACQSVSDCVTACATAGGTTGSCENGSDCVENGDPSMKACLPPTYWFDPTEALSESGTTIQAAELTLVAINYDDPIVLTDFDVTLPSSATIRGIQFEVRRNADGGFAEDDTVQLVVNGVPVGANHAQSGPWPMTLSYARYGGADDAWGVALTPADLAASGFGISVAPRYTGPTAGNDRAHVDSVHLLVYYATPCE